MAGDEQERHPRGMRLVNTLLFFGLLGPCVLPAQVKEQEKLQELSEQDRLYKQTLLRRTLDSAVVFMEQGHYADADARLKYVLRNIESVPSDLAFYFGKNSYLMGQYKQSLDWLTKYIQLKGSAGQFSNEAVELVRKAESEILSQNTASARKTQETLSSSYNIDCGPSGRVICPVCKGSTVIIKRGYFNNEYRTCPYCAEQGFLSCADYNLLLRGQLSPNR
jgi:hypothetical protein